MTLATIGIELAASLWLATGANFAAQSPSSPGTYRVLYDFKGLDDGLAPSGGLIADRDGSLYGATSSGGGIVSCNDQCGTVFELTKARTAYSERILYSFHGGADGEYPVGGLIMDKSGALFGVTRAGGSSGAGTVFKLTPVGSAYSKRTLYSFQGGNDGATPESGLIADATGALYGTTFYGGGTPCNFGEGCGTVFKLVPKASRYQEIVLHRFQLNGADGFYPNARVMLDESGELLGTTSLGGSTTRCGNGGCGTVFMLAPGPSGYAETVLHSFQGRPNDGALPMANLITEHGALYGTTAYGGASSNCGSPNWEGCGTIFRLTPRRTGYLARILYNFESGSDGQRPMAGLTPGARGTFFGTTYYGGCEDCGTVFSLTPSRFGYVEAVLHVFDRENGDGEWPSGNVIRDRRGVLFGATVGGGTCGCGMVFELKP